MTVRCNRPEGCNTGLACAKADGCGYGEAWGYMPCNLPAGCNDPRACKSFGSCGSAGVAKPTCNAWSQCVDPQYCATVGACSVPVGSPVPTSGTVAHGVLLEAAGIVEGARNTTHGDKERSFTAIAGLWNAYLEARKVGGPVTAFDVAQLMVLLKIGRSVQGTPHRDHFIDAAGYSAIAAELSGG